MVSAVLAKLLGPNLAQGIKLWVPSGATWGGVCGVTLVYLTDWRLILDYVPYVNGKFSEKD
ncbi:cytochrome b-c1 complex subunit 10 [Lampetra fluviatilis]